MVDFEMYDMQFEKAVRQGELEVIRELIKTVGYIPVHATSEAAIAGYYKIVDYLIKGGGGVHGMGLEALRDAGRTEMIKFVKDRRGFIMAASVEND